MKNLKLLNKKYLSVISFCLFLGLSAQSQEPADIWNINEKKTTESTDVIENNKEDDEGYMIRQGESYNYLTQGVDLCTTVDSYVILRAESFETGYILIFCILRLLICIF